MQDIISLEGKRILVVEDDDLNFIYIKQIIKITKGDVIRAKNGESGVEIALQEKFDLILMDIQLPDISGTEVTALIRKKDTVTPIIAQTASRTPHEIEAIYQSGCTDILVKPYTIKDFSKIIKKYI